MKKILFLAIWTASVAAYALPTYEPFTEFAPNLAAHPITEVVTAPNGNSIGTNANSYVTNCLDLSTNGFTAPSGELWGNVAFSGTGNSTLHGLDIAIISNVTIFPQSTVSSLLPSGFPGLPDSGQSITNFVENSAQPNLWQTTNWTQSNYVGNSALLKFASTVTRPASGTKTLFFSYLFNVAQQGQLGSGNVGRYLALLSSTNLTLPSASYATWGSFFNTFNGTSVRYACHGLIQDVAQSSYYIGGCDSVAGKSFSTTPLTGSYGQSVFVVGCYEFNAGGTDSNIMWLNPSTSTFGGATSPTSQIYSFKMGFNMSDIGGICFIDRVGNGASGGVGTNFIANLIVGSTWSYVTGGPEFTTQPNSFTGSAGSSPSFTAAAVAAGQSVSYQWQIARNGTTNNLSDGAGTAGGSATVSGSSTGTLTLSGVSSGDAATYICQATANGTTFTLNSSAAVLAVDPSITSNPQNASALYGQQATFSASATTTQPSLSYQWYLNGNPLSNGVQTDGSVVSGSSGTITGGSVNSTLVVSNVSYQDSGNSYTFYVTNNVNSSSLSSAGTLTVYDFYVATPPANTIVAAGGTANFSVTANGSPTINYQWYFNGNPLSDGPTGSGSTVAGSQTANLSISTVSDADDGSYSVYIYGNSSGQATNSPSATLLVADPVQFPAGVSGPVSRTQRAGDHTAFTVVATGNDLSYQWQFNGTNIPGATSSSLSVANIQTANAGSYDCVVSNPATPSGAPSPTATLSVINSAILPLSSSNILVARIGDGAQAYSGATGNTIFLDQYTTNGTYVDTVQIPDENTNQVYGTGGPTTIFGSPALLAQGGAGTDGANSTFLTLSANSQEYLTFAGYCEQYPFSGGNVTVGGTNWFRGLASLNAFGIYSMMYTNQGLYNGGPHTIRGTVTLDGTNFWTSGQAGANGIKFVNTTVSAYATGNGIPVITSGAASDRVVQVVAGNLVFSDTAGQYGAGLYACQGTPEPAPSGNVTAVNEILAENGQPADFAFSPDGATVYIADTQITGNGGGIQRWDTNFGGSGWSYSYTLQPVNGGTNGASALAVYWPTNVSAWGANVTGAVIYATTYGDVTNSLIEVVDNGNGSTATTIATAGPNQAFRGVRFGPTAVPVAIAQGPASQTNFVNNNVTFTVSATGSAPLYYQWQLNGNNIANATNSTFTTNNITMASGGTYTVIVTNLIPSTATASATLQVIAGAPSFAEGVQSFSEPVGDHLAFVPAVNGSTPISAQWYFGTNALPNQTNLYLVLTDIQTSQSGIYTLKLTNVYGTAQSSGSLTVTPVPSFLATNNLIVARIGDGVQALSGATGNTLYLDQYNASGSYVSSIQIPDEATGHAYGTGSTNSVGTSPALIVAGANGPAPDAQVGALLNLSADGLTLNFGGYSEAYPFGGADVTATGGGSQSYTRSFGSVNAGGVYSLVYTTYALYNQGNHVIHSIVTLDQTNYWATGEGSVGNGLRYLNIYTTQQGSIPSIAGTATGVRQVHIINGTLFFSDAGTTGSSAGVYTITGALPLAAETGTTPTLLVSDTNSPVDFAISPDQQTIYIADNSAVGSGGGIQRWDADPNVGGYTNSYTFSTGAGYTAGARGLTVDFSAQSVWGLGATGAKIYATTAESGGNRFIKIVDNGASSAVTTIATAPASSTFSGVSFGPVSVPVSIVSGPANQVAVTGTGVEFSVVASGTGPLSYQWMWNGTNIAGGTLSTLSVSAAQAVQGGSYSVQVSNPIPSSQTSGSATISFAPNLSFFTNFASWSSNGTAGSGLPMFDANGETNVLELTDSTAHQCSATFYQSPLYIGGFLASWTYQVVNPTGTVADGMAFVVQNDPRGAAAAGDSTSQNGGSLGYGNPSGITNSVALEFNIFTNASGGEGIALDTNTATGPYTSTAPVSLNSGDPINVTVEYANGLANVSLYDTVTSNSFTRSAALNIPAVVGGNEAYVGFTGATGGSVSTQTVSNFVFHSLINLNVANPGNNTLVLSWPSVGIGAYSLQQSTALGPASWSPVTNTITTVNGTNSVTVPLGGTSMFYELVNP